MSDPTIENVTIRGERATLRDWTRSDIEAYRKWIVPPEGGGVHAWQLFDGPFYGRWTADGANRWCDGLLRKAHDGVWPHIRENLAIADAATGEFVGQVSWYWQEKPSDPSPDGTRLLPWRRLGLVIFDPRHWSGGYGSDALALWTTYLFGATDSERLDFATWSGNTGMCKVGQKLGFTEEARFRNARMVRGEVCDEVVYGVLREEWAARR
ncbi:GNAT family N-acetyltransferase [Sinomonas terrae]|uniref:GNAT family N-acetyltransferase n=1 Tax=Sinomonas terrae TaxID=2908838 RepID=A0ABS9U4E9_9MICC|nr:GNAT family protein [Sinomonas terrae]MCH6471465.1 GNAT family N-acetyltransferase [Sinomonas terrae]